MKWHLLPDGPVREVVGVLTYGASKYRERNWEDGLVYSRVYDSAMRHIDAFRAGTLMDAESGRHHLAHAVCNLLFLLDYELGGRREELNDL